MGPKSYTYVQKNMICWVLRSCYFSTILLACSFSHSDFPGVPISRPTIVDMEPETVRVSWQKVNVPSFSTTDEPLLYMLEMQEPPKRDWRPVARDVPDLSYTVRGLTPGQDYRFRVKARTMGGGYGEPSPSTSLYRTLGNILINLST